MESETITKSWNKLLSVPDSAQVQTVSVSATVETDTIQDSCDISPAERADWLTSDNHDTGYHELTDGHIPEVWMEMKMMKVRVL